MKKNIKIITNKTPTLELTLSKHQEVLFNFKLILN